ncbi:MAG: CotH kinase family protein, partial [Nannocystaceae bacterium]|nr:CotH kinase family protein [Nannocystaceae bacterium]
FYYAADPDLNGATFADAGACVKGAGTARTLDEKAAFKIHLGWDDPEVAGCGEERRFHGLKRVTLNNMVQDNSYLRETLGYQFYAALGLGVPRTQFANLSINDEHFGFYLHVETVDRRFLARRFDSRKGMLFEAIYGGGRNCDLSPEKLGASSDDSCFKASFSTDECDGDTEGYDVTDHSHLQRLGEQIAAIAPGELYTGLQPLLDIDEYLSLFAAEVIGGAGDSHFYHWNNYRMYHEPTEDLWHIIPTGIDTSFSSWLPPDTDGAEPVVYLAQRCLTEAPCVARLVEIMEAALDTFDAMDFEARMDALIEVIDADVASDPRSEASSSQISASRNSMRTFIQTRRATVEPLLETWQAAVR